MTISISDINKFLKQTFPNNTVIVTKVNLHEIDVTVKKVTKKEGMTIKRVLGNYIDKTGATSYV